MHRERQHLGAGCSGRAEIGLLDESARGEGRLVADEMPVVDPGADPALFEVSAQSVAAARSRAARASGGLAVRIPVQL